MEAACFALRLDRPYVFDFICYAWRLIHVQSRPIPPLPVHLGGKSGGNRYLLIAIRVEDDMEVRAAYKIRGFADIGDGVVFITHVGQMLKYCIRTFDTFDGGNRGDHFTVLGAADNKGGKFDFQVMATNHIHTANLLVIDDCVLALPTNSDAYSNETGYVPEPGKIFIFDGRQHLCVQGENAGHMFLMNLATGELTTQPTEHEVLTTRV